MCLSKLSLAAFIRNLSPWSNNELVSRSTEFITLAWAIIALLGTSFQCSLPRTWDIWNGKCFDLVLSKTLAAIRGQCSYTVSPGFMAILCWNFEYPSRLVDSYSRSALGLSGTGLVGETPSVCHRLLTTNLVSRPSYS